MLDGTEAERWERSVGWGGGAHRTIDPLFNVMFLRLFGTEESKAMTRDLVNVVLEAAGMEPIDEIEHLSGDHAQIAGAIDCYTPRYDVKVVAEGRMVDVEAQRQSTAVAERSLLYAAKNIAMSMKAGMDYTDYPQSIVIMLYDAAPLFPDDDALVHVARMRWDDASETFSEKLVVILVETDKVRRAHPTFDSVVQSDRLLMWLYLLVKGYRDEGEMRQMAGGFQEVLDFARLYDIALDDPDIQQHYDDWFSAECDHVSELGFARREGKAEGLAEGAMEREIELVAKWRAKGMSEEEITALLA